MPTQDLTSYIKNDPNGRLTVSAAKVQGDNVTGGDGVTNVYKDFGADHFDALNFLLEAYVGSSATVSATAGCNFVNTAAPDSTKRTNLATTDAGAWIHNEGGTASVQLWRGDIETRDIYNGSFNTIYYLKMERAAGNDTITIKIYSDSGRTTLLDTLTISGYGTSTKWRYLFALVTHSDGSGGEHWYGYYQNMDLNEKNTLTVTVTAKARVKLTDITKTNQAKARIKIIDVTKTIQAKGRIKQVDITKTVQAKADVKKTTDQTIQAKGRILVVNEKTNQAKARILQTVDKTIQAKAYILKGQQKTIQAKADIRKEDITETSQAKARILKTSDKTIQARGRIKQADIIKTATSKAKIKNAQSKTIQARGRVFGSATVQTIQVKGRIVKTSSKNIQAKGKIKQAGLTKTLTAKARLWAARLGVTHGLRGQYAQPGYRSTASVREGTRLVKSG
jgi:hypothetical protein